MKKIASESASRAVKRSQIDLASESLTAMTYWPLPSVAARLVGAGAIDHGGVRRWKGERHLLHLLWRAFETVSMMAASLGRPATPFASLPFPYQTFANRL